MFNNVDIAEYYDTTQNHYERWWNLKESLSLHYGIWNHDTKSFSEAILNTNKILAEKAQISRGNIVLDAGCGVGGAAVFLAKTKGCQVTGITLSSKQIETARRHRVELNLEEQINFEQQDYCNTNFEDESFDVVWACESVCYASSDEFIKESYRLLKKGGTLILSDFFLLKEDNVNHPFINKWADAWGVNSFHTKAKFESELTTFGYNSPNIHDFTKEITKSSKRMYVASLLGKFPSLLYNMLYPNVSRFARNHYQSGIYQWKALKEGLWKYLVIKAVK